jgi:RHS repeat-associated protein
MKRLLCGIILCVLGTGWAGAQQAVNAWSSQDYDFYAGDFNGDGYTDVLFIARSPNLPSGILLSDGTSPSILSQTWASNYLGIPWSSNAYTVVLGDFNGDGKTDILLQSNGPGDSYLLLTDASGKITAISQTIPAQMMGLIWTFDQHHLVAGDFNGSGRAGLYFQPTGPGGTSAIVYTDATGQFTGAAPAQTWEDGYLGFNWSVAEANVYAGDFNGDGRADLLIQAQPVTSTAGGATSYSYPPNMNGVVLSAPGAQPFAMKGVQSWSREASGVDWSPLSNNLVIGDFNGDGRADVLFQPVVAGGASYLLFGNAPGPIFSNANGPLPSDTAISAEVAVLLTGRFGSTSTDGLLVQSTSRAGTNSVANNISSRIHGAALGLPVLSSTSLSMTGIGYPPDSSSSAVGKRLTATPLAATITPTSAGRTAGQFSVGPTGAATYNIPLWTPPGARGVEPHLALHYVSGGPDGPMGPGWSLTGLSAIVRCGKTYASNGGAPLGVTLSTNDDICVDGNRLRITSGTPLYTGATYQTEIADFSLVTANGTTGSPAQYFIVQGKDGRSYEYGNTTDSRITASGASAPYAWALNKARDRQGNNMTFTYTGGTMVTLSKIQYTATPGTNNAAPYEVDFSYIARVGGTTISKYVAGGVVSQANQLDNITVLSLQPSSTIVRKYQLGYAASPTTNRPLLQTLQECGGSAGTDCIRPTSIGYQPGAANWSTTPTSSGLTGQYGFYTVDLNGDGIPDVLYGKLSGSTINWYARIATTSGYGSEIATGASTNTAAGSQGLVLGNLDGTGQVEFLAPVGSTLYAYKYNGSGFTNSSTGAPSGMGQYVADWDGDGLPDLVEYGPITGTTVTVRQNTTTAGGAVTFASTVQTVFTATSPNTLILTNPVLPVDFNGDGRADMLIRVFHTLLRGGSKFYDYSVLSNGFSSAPTQISLNTQPDGEGIIDGASESAGSATVLFGDWNGDGCTDVITAKQIFISDCTGHFTSFPSNIPLLAAGSRPFPYPMQVLDADGDGQMDLVYPDPTSNTWFVARSTGAGIAAGTGTGIAYASTKSLGSTDRDSDGQPDLFTIDSTNGYAVNYYLHSSAGAPPDLGNSISDGFGINFSPTYVPISQNNYTKYATARFPDVDIQAPMYVVNQFSASDGTGGTYTNDFWYYGARLSLQGRGFEGFYAARQHDSRAPIPGTTVYQYSYYQQSFPTIGSVLEQDTIASGGTYIARTVNSYTDMTPGGLSGTSCSLCHFPYINSSTVYNFEPTGSKAGGQTSYVSYTTTNYTYDSYGTLTDTKATTTDADSTPPASPFNGQSWIAEIANTITNDNSAANWCLGRPSSTTTTKTVPGQSAQTRTVAHTIDYVNCRATVETIEPNDSRLKVTTSFGFDSCGNTSSVSVVGLDQNGNAMPARTTTTNYSYSSPQRCALPEAVTNALNLNQTTVTVYNYNFGLPSSTTDPNQILINWFYDNFGRKTKEIRPDGTYTTYTYNDCVSSSCWGVSDLRFLAYNYVYASDGTQLRLEEKFYDGLDRQRYEEINRVLGAWTVQVFYYDNLGRKTETTLPYSSAGNGYHLYTYDVVNRLTLDALYTSGGGLYRTVSMGYSGQTVTVTDPNGNTITKVTDVAGKIRWVTDPSTNGTVAGTTKYTFDPFGNLITILDADSVTSSYSYNIRGFKFASNDADAGSWGFTPDSLNELVSQTDANQNVTTFGYDLLGRMTSRTERAESTTPIQWVYGTSSSAHNINRIVTVTKPDGYAEGYTYDTVGRPQTVTYTEDSTNYPFTYAYNNAGTVDTITYPVSTSGYQFVLKNVYDAYGYLNAVKDNSAGTVFWSLSSANDSSLPTLEALGNGVQVATSYTPWTNEMITRTEGSGGSTTNLQNLTYNWDLTGNLHQRVDNRQGLTEQFGYDSMNRLLNSTLNSTNNLTLTYDASGNINSKSDVSSSAYVYDTVHKHAVKTAGSWSMTYDANGNMITRGGGSIGYYSYNLPNTISYSGNSTQFFYNASHQRWKQAASYSGTVETTHYIGGMLEIMTRGSNPTEYRHQIPSGSGMAVYTRRTDGSTSTYYATTDHLGSSDLVMDGSANVLTRESFTPFGARRGSAWTGTPSSGDYTAFGNTTRKGFTGHEMLDSVALVHMNGRVYDPWLGRFLSADVLIQNLAATESINPYAYAWNDPLKYIDPTGHGIFETILSIFFAAVAFFTLQPELVELLGSYFWGSVVAGGIAGFVGGFIGALQATGSLSAALSAGLVLGVTGALFAGVGVYADDLNLDWGIRDKVLAHAFVGCISGELSSGNCGKGALSAAVSEYVGSQVLHGNEGGFWGKTLQTVKYALIGGITSKLAHESFEEGFSVAAAGYLFNDAAQTLRNNKAQHDLAVAAVSAELTREGKVVIDTEVGASNPAVPYTRVYDIVVYDPADGNVYGVEVKSTSTGIFRLNAKQVAFDAATVRGGTVTSDGDYLNGVMYHGVSVVDVPATVWATVQLWLALRQAQIPYATTLRPPYP